jgi:hypothetical protein
MDAPRRTRRMPISAGLSSRPSREGWQRVDFDRRARFYIRHAFADQLVGFKHVDESQRAPTMAG